MARNTHVSNRDLDLRIKGHLYEIRETNEEVIGGEQGYPMAENGYQATLTSVAICADEDVIDAVAKHIQDEMRKLGSRPKNRKIRRVARQLVSEAGYPPNKYLNRA
jgi:hypothetical protein